MKIETKLEFKNYLKLMFMLTYRRPIMIILITFTVIALAFSFLISQDTNFLLVDTYYVSLGVVLYLIVGLPLSIYFNSRRIFSTNGLIKEKIIYEFTDEKICHTGETFYIEMDWTKIYKIVEIRQWILIYQSKVHVNIISIESFGDNLMEFKNLVRSKKIKAKLK